MLGSLLTSLRRSDPGFDTRWTNPLADHGFKHATQDTAFTVHRPWQTHRGGRSEQRSDTRLSNALADQSYRPLPLNMPFSKLAMLLWKRATPDRLRCFSKHALPNKPGWQLAFSGRSEQHSNSRLSNALADPGFKRARPDTSSLPAGSTEAAFTVHMLVPLLAKRSRRTAWSRPTLQQTEHLDQTDPLFSLAAVFEFKHTAGQERLSFGECLGHALGAAGSVQWTAGLVCNSEAACLRMRSEQLSGAVFAG